MTNSIYILIYGGIILYSVLIMIQMFSYSFNNKMYVEVEINKYVSSISYNNSIYMIFVYISLILIITLISHIIFKMGIFNMILYSICYWLIGTGLGIYLLPFVVYSVLIFVYMFDSFSYSLNISGSYHKYISILSQYSGSNYNVGGLFSVLDICVVSSLVRGFYVFVNWMYQMLYYGVRMWLVFVLHSFSLGSFGSLISVISDNCLVLSMFYFGLLVIGIILYLIVVFYLCIQIYVYISFSLSFLNSTILLLFNSFVSYSSNSMLYSSYYYLIPVSLVDLININFIMYICILYIVLLYLIPLLISSVSYLYKYLYNNISNSYVCNSISFNLATIVSHYLISVSFYFYSFSSPLLIVLLICGGMTIVLNNIIFLIGYCNMFLSNSINLILSSLFSLNSNKSNSYSQYVLSSNVISYLLNNSNSSIYFTNISNVSNVISFFSFSSIILSVGILLILYSGSIRVIFGLILVVISICQLLFNLGYFMLPILLILSVISISIIVLVLFSSSYYMCNSDISILMLISYSVCLYISSCSIGSYNLIRSSELIGYLILFSSNLMLCLLILLSYIFLLILIRFNSSISLSYSISYYSVVSSLMFSVISSLMFSYIYLLFLVGVLICYIPIIIRYSSRIYKWSSDIYSVGIGNSLSNSIYFNISSLSIGSYFFYLYIYIFVYLDIVINYIIILYLIGSYSSLISVIFLYSILISVSVLLYYFNNSSNSSNYLSLTSISNSICRYMCIIKSSFIVIQVKSIYIINESSSVISYKVIGYSGIFNSVISNNSSINIGSIIVVDRNNLLSGSILLSNFYDVIYSYINSNRYNVCMVYFLIGITTSSINNINSISNISIFK